MGLNFRCFRGYNGFHENYSTKISNAHKRAPIIELRNVFNENFVDSYPRNLSPTEFKSYTVYIMYTAFKIVAELKIHQYIHSGGHFTEFNQILPNFQLCSNMYLAMLSE